MDNQNLVLFLSVSLLVIVAPGPDNILVLTRGITMGRMAAWVSASGAGVGLVCHSLLAAMGLSALVSQSTAAYAAVKYVGAAYLLYLGVQSLRHRGEFSVPQPGAVGLRRVFGQAVASNLLNPKIAVFFLAYLPQFTEPATGGVGWQLLGFGLVFALLTWLVFSVIAHFSGVLGGWLRRRPGVRSGLGWVTGGVFIALGLRLALPERR